MKIDLTAYLSRRSRGCACLSWNHVIGTDLLHNRIHRLLNVFKKRLRIDADPQREDHQRHHVSPLAHTEIRQIFVLRIVDRAEEHALVEPQEIARVKNDSQRRPRRPVGIRFKRSSQCQKLRYKHSEQRQPDRGHHHAEEDRRVTRHHVRESAKLRHVARVSPLVNYSDEKKERA